MFKFQRVLSDGVNWQDNLFIEDESIGMIGHDKDGFYLYIKRELTLKEINLLIAQLTISNPSLLNEKIEIKLQ